MDFVDVEEECLENLSQRLALPSESTVLYLFRVAAFKLIVHDAES